VEESEGPGGAAEEAKKRRVLRDALLHNFWVGTLAIVTNGKEDITMNLELDA